ncbi:outer membrane protein assembly factor BamD [Aestuariirhabdus litorea]|uniref:Outer membrane protein assembly factor BamD n=1 Tax=Aestuariirhabdus litorea TaxID=2528527 RepID=A0A3P3VNP3_9GAMM|nr:outer membrane protein assembly factor BamD [Aestuariirhabdus litorea]RRJ83266.1 outer membrane protein assembly factor BamD [Aestuariirhabdus litorea]RWW93425.1 outer membrane protein assembly factor BamD [Endozoicomonadaceae bacterium GTF-13]
MRSFRNLITPLVALLLVACAADDKNLIPEDLSETELYRKAQSALELRNFGEAVDNLRALESRYPFGSYAEHAQLELIYAYYMRQEPESAKATAERFIRLHPQHPNVDYAYYMKGLASYTADVGLMERYVEIDMSRRDPGQARDSFTEFAELLNRFPESPYATDARQRMIFLRNQLSLYEIHVADYYLKRKAYVAAVNRGQYVVENMQRTPAVPAALAVMVEGYLQLGLDEEAQSTLEVMRLNYPKHPSLDEAGNFIGYKRFDDVDPSVWTIISFDLIGGGEAETPQPPASSD